VFVWSGECDTVLSLFAVNEIGDGGATALAKALESNSTLATLNLARTCFTAAIVAIDVDVCLVSDE
jgi:hypothetical protein